MEDALIWLYILNLVINDERLEGLGRGRGAIQRPVTDGRDRCGLIRQGLGDLKVVERGRANRPRVAENALGFTVQIGEFGRIWFCGEDRERGLDGWGQLYASVNTESSMYLRSTPWLRCHRSQNTSRCRQ